jgi:hypothetical protein
MFAVCPKKSRSGIPFVFLHLSLLACLSVYAPASVIIDDFLTTQAIPPGSCVTGSDMIGGERDAYISYSYAQANINSTAPGQLYYRSGFDHFNYIHLIYDGADGLYSNNDIGGLGNADLTDGETCNGFIFNFTQVPPYTVHIWVDLLQDDNTQGYGYVYANNTGAIFLAFDEFVADPPAAAPPAGNATYAPPVLIDFASVGYIHITMAIYGGDDTFVLDSITTDYVAPEPASAMIMILGAAMAAARRRR